MTQDLYRKEALDHITQRLYGEVILKSPPASWVITLVLLLVLAVMTGLLFFTSVATEDGSVPVIKWLISRMG